jgi:prefoldin subunit 5
VDDDFRDDASELDWLRSQVEVLEANIQTAQQLLVQAQENYNRVHSLLEEIARELAPEELDEARRRHVEFASEEEMAHWIISTVRGKINRLTLLSAPRPADASAECADLASLYEASKREIEEMSRKLDLLQDQVKALQAENTALREFKVRAAKTLQDVGLSVEGKEPGRSESLQEQVEIPWLEKWEQGPLYDATKALLEIMGTQGYCWRKDLERALAGKGVRPNRINEAFRFARQTFAEVEMPPNEAGSGRAAGLWYLSTEGKIAFRKLFGRPPVKGEYERGIERHKNVKHFALILMVRQCLLECGATSVDMDPAPIEAPEGRFDPDIVAVYGDGTIYVEAERGGRKNAEDRRKKWKIMRSITDTFHIAVPNAKVQAQIMEEITRWAYTEQMNLTLRICTVSLWTKGNREVPWTMEQEIKGM